MMPDNAIYYHLAYAATVVLYGLYAFTLVLRRRALERRRERERPR
jgi:heme exporter protein D